MSRWFRLYDELLDDPKVQKLHPALFKVLVNVWCVASRHEGRLPSPAHLSFSLRMTEDETFRAVSKLADAGFIDTDAVTGEQRPHGWEARQYRSDVSTDRVRAHRDRQKSAKNPDPPPDDKPGAGNGHETFHATPPEQRQNRTDSSVANATGTVVPHPAADFCKAVFESGKALLTAAGKTPREAGTIIGRLRSAVGDPQALILIRQSETEGHEDPVAWLMAAAETRNGSRKPNPRQTLRGSRPNPAIDMLNDALADEQAERGDPPFGGGTGLALPAIGGG